MAKLIRNGRVEDDARIVVTLNEGDTPEAVALPAGALLVPLAVWQARRDELAGRDVGVWLAGDEDPAALADDLASLPVVGVHFPAFTDGRGSSIAVLLRSRYGYSGEVRAIGDVLRDQFNYYTRCGINALQPAEGRYTGAQLEAAVASLTDFSLPYQASVQDPEPLFRRVARAA
ncbi:MAG: DUF934 domain-containing protein [Pseudazoarcus pumilus]|nr:DUF934 domain-containing protein [Pseudazoarcus pumilus]